MCEPAGPPGLFRKAPEICPSEFFQWITTFLSGSGAPAHPALLEMAVSLAECSHDRGASLYMPANATSHPRAAAVRQLHVLSMLLRQALGDVPRAQHAAPSFLSELGTPEAAARLLEHAREAESRASSQFLDECELLLHSRTAASASLTSAPGWGGAAEMAVATYLRLRREHRKMLETELERSIAMVDFSNRSPRSLATLVRRARPLLAQEFKLKLYFGQVALAVSPAARPVNVRILRSTTLHPRSVFEQLFSQLSSLPPVLFRLGASDSPPILVSLTDEAVQGTHGPYRQVLIDMCEEFASAARARGLGVPDPSVPRDARDLFIPSPNVVNQTGEDRDKLVPRPSAATPACLARYEFLGIMCGVAMRSRTTLDLPFTSYVWKSLLGEPLELADLAAIDHNFVRSLQPPEPDPGHQDAARVPGHHHEPADSDDSDTETGQAGEGKPCAGVSLRGSPFRVQLSDQTERALGPDPARVIKTAADQAEYRELALEARLKESQAQLHAMRRGLLSVIPELALVTLEWRDLERVVCGDPEISVENLKAHTHYARELNENEPLVVNFWKVLEDFTKEQKVAFVRFAWARSRLPVTDLEWNNSRMLLGVQPLRRGVDPDARLPRSETCFFNVHLPRYTNIDVLRAKLLYAIHADPTSMAGDD